MRRWRECKKKAVLEVHRAVVFTEWDTTSRGVAYQIYFIPDNYITIRNSSNITVILEQQQNTFFFFFGFPSQGCSVAQNNFMFNHGVKKCIQESKARKAETHSALEAVSVQLSLLADYSHSKITGESYSLSPAEGNTVLGNKRTQPTISS